MEVTHGRRDCATARESRADRSRRIVARELIREARSTRSTEVDSVPDSIDAGA